MKYELRHDHTVLKMLKITKCTFRTPKRHERVFAVVCRDDALRFSPSRFLTAQFVSSSSESGINARVAPSQNDTSVFITFADRGLAMEATRRVPYPGSKYTLELTLGEAADISFDRLHMDMVVVYAVDPTRRTWRGADLYFARRGSASSLSLLSPIASYDLS
jgi:hypothetical protein